MLYCPPGVGVFLVESIPKNTRSRCHIFYPTQTPEIQVNHFLHLTLNLRVLTRACWNGTIYFETENFFWASPFPLIATKLAVFSLKNPAAWEERFRYIPIVPRGVTTRAKGTQIPGRRITAGASENPNNVTSSFFNSTFASERPQVRTWGRQTCFLPVAPSNLITPLPIITYKSFLNVVHMHVVIG